MSESERWARVKSIFDAAVACPPGDRPGLLREMCGDDPGLQTSVESLLAADAETPSGFAPSVDAGARGRVFDAVADVLDARTGGLSPGDRLGDYEIRGFLGAVAWAARTGLATSRLAATSGSRSCPGRR